MTSTTSSAVQGLLLALPHALTLPTGGTYTGFCSSTPQSFIKQQSSNFQSTSDPASTFIMRFAILAAVLATMAVAAPVADPNNPKFDYVSLDLRSTAIPQAC